MVNPFGYSALRSNPQEVREGHRGLSVPDRVTVAVVSLLAVAIGLVVLAIGLFGWNVSWPVALWAAEAAGSRRLVAAGVGAALALLGAAAVRPALTLGGGDRAIMRATGLGEVYITLRAIQTLARRAAAQVQGIREVEVQVRPGPTGDVSVRVMLAVAPDVNIPDLCDEVQARIEQYLRQTAGISCGKIGVWVRGVAKEGRSTAGRAATS